MPDRSIVIAAAAACVLCVAASFAPQQPQQPRTAYGDWLAGHIGKSFDLLAERTLAVSNMNGALKLAVVGADFVAFDGPNERVCVPLAILRVQADK